MRWIHARRSTIKKIRKFRLGRRLRQLRAGLTTGAADDDPSGIATYSQAGAQFGFSMLWTVVFTLPLMVAIQMVSARIGFITGRGLTANIRERFQRWVLLRKAASHCDWTGRKDGASTV